MLSSKKEYGAKKQCRNVAFAPTEQVCLFYKQLLASHCKNKLLPPADVYRSLHHSQRPTRKLEARINAAM
jgi:hypothetical protein